MGSYSSLRDDLLERIKESSIAVPDMQPAFDKWPATFVNPNWEKTIPWLNQRLEILFPDRATSTKLKNCDFALFGAVWWPRAGPEQMKVLTWLAVWLFVWDDQIDESTGRLTNDFEASQSVRERTIAFVAQSLGLEEVSDTATTDLVPDNGIIASFDFVGSALRKAYNINQRRRFMDEMLYYFEMSQKEQEARLDGRVLSLGEYWRIRMGTSAVGVISAVNEYSVGVTIPDHIMNHPEMKNIWDECNINVSIVNDLLSLQKEVSKGGIDSLVPILCMHMSASEAVQSSFTQLKASMARLDIAAENLLSVPRNNVDRKLTYEFIDDCRYNCSGNHYWSLRTQRYGMASAPRNAEGGRIITFM